MQGRPNHYRGGVLFTMDKREFLKTSGAALTGCILSRMLPAQTQSAPRTNWAGNYTYSAPNLLEPHSTEQVQAAVREIWPQVTTENLAALTDIAGYRTEFLALFGFGLAGIDYDAEIEPHLPMV